MTYHRSPPSFLPPSISLCCAFVVVGLLAFGNVTACVVDDLLLTQALDQTHENPPPPPSTLLRGNLAEGVEGELAFWNTTGGRIAPLQTTLEARTYSAEFSGTDSFTATRISVQQGASVTFGLVPQIPSALSVYSPRIVIDLPDSLPPMSSLNDETTALTLIVERRAIDAGGLQTLSAQQLTSTLRELSPQFEEASAVLKLRQAITRLQNAAKNAPTGTPVVFHLPENRADHASPLNQAFIARVEIDYDEDGTIDTNTEAFDLLLEEASQEIAFEICIDPDVVRVVFQLDFNENSNLNCEPIDRFQWVEPDPGDGVFFTGAPHVDQPNCTDHPEDETCATPEQIAALHEQLGGFTPNLLPMFDDGTNGDAMAGDGVWTLSFVVPRGVRIGYKYTYGRGGQGWTATEEWPGNSRLLQALDRDENNIVVRYDYFGDETSNKDKQNSLSPSRGGRGTIDFLSDANGDGLIDAQENRIDTDGDCIPDAWPSPGPTSPVLCDQ